MKEMMNVIKSLAIMSKTSKSHEKNKIIFFLTSMIISYGLFCQHLKTCTDFRAYLPLQCITCTTQIYGRDTFAYQTPPLLPGHVDTSSTVVQIASKNCLDISYP